NTVRNAATGISIHQDSGFVASASIDGNTISGNTTGIDADGGSAAIDRNSITANGTGVRVRNGGSLTSVTENFVTNSAVDGILIDASAGAIAAVFNNNLSGNAGFGLNNHALTSIVAEHNWWGSRAAASVHDEVFGNV